MSFQCEPKITITNLDPNQNEKMGTLNLEFADPSHWHKILKQTSTKNTPHLYI